MMDSTPRAAWTLPESSQDTVDREHLIRGVFSRIFNEEPDPVRLGHYLVLAKLGEGAMGVVYEAKDEKLGRKVAIKLLRKHGDPVGQRRFLREARALARLSHPNVVQIHDIDEANGRAFIVMELVDGETFNSWLGREARSLVEILDVFVAAGRGLQAAHDNGLVHRDFKPANVMLGNDGRARVLDFGLVRDANMSDSGDGFGPGEQATELTGVGAMMGTPAYMAPEQFRDQEATPKTDQFSFCVALWEAINGARPFGGTTMLELSEAVNAGRLERVDRSRTPRWLRMVLSRGLATEPDQRWPSLDSLLSALRAGAARQRLRSFRREHLQTRSVLRTVVGAVAIFLLGVVFGDDHEYMSELATAVDSPEVLSLQLPQRERDASPDWVGTKIQYARTLVAPPRRREQPDEDSGAPASESRSPSRHDDPKANTGTIETAAFEASGQVHIESRLYPPMVPSLLESRKYGRPRPPQPTKPGLRLAPRTSSMVPSPNLAGSPTQAGRALNSMHGTPKCDDAGSGELSP